MPADVGRRGGRALHRRLRTADRAGPSCPANSRRRRASSERCRARPCRRREAEMALVPIIMGSRSDLAHAAGDRRARWASGASEPDAGGLGAQGRAYLLDLLAAYEADPEPKVYITIAGRSNALSGLVDANVSCAGDRLPALLRAVRRRRPVLVAAHAVRRRAGRRARAGGRGAAGGQDPGARRSGAAPAHRRAQQAAAAQIIADDEDAAAAPARHRLQRSTTHDGIAHGMALTTRPPARSLRRLRHLRAGRRRGPPHLLRPVSPCSIAARRAPASPPATATQPMLHKGMGLVAQVFNEENLRPLKGHLAIGHTRYSTSGSSHIRNAQPYLIETMHGPLGVAHNGNLTNALTLRRQLLERGVGLSSSSDSEVITQMLAAPPSGRRAGRAGLGSAHRRLHGAGRGRLLAGDPDPRRRLCRARPLGPAPAVPGRAAQQWPPRLRGRLRDRARWRPIGAAICARSDPARSCAWTALASTLYKGATPARGSSLCIFEYVYFARPDSVLEGQTVHRVRQRLGEELAREAPVDADVVIGVPDSATPGSHRLRPGLRHPLQRGADQEPLHRPHLHPARRPPPPGGRAPEVQPADRQPAGQARRADRRLDRARQHHRPARGAAARGRRHARSTCASPPRRSAIPASWASTWRPTTS